LSHKKGQPPTKELLHNLSRYLGNQSQFSQTEVLQEKFNYGWCYHQPLSFMVGDNTDHRLNLQRKELLKLGVVQKTIQMVVGMDLKKDFV
jgi:hypothetical protein